MMRASFDKRWLLPVGILTASALVALVVVFDPSFVGRTADELDQQPASRTTTGCSGALATDYACHQRRYQNLVRDSGVQAAFAELKDEFKKNELVKHNCHQMTHVIGRTAAGLYGDLPSTYSRGDPFCEAGYYHGAMEAIAAETELDKILEEADALCADTGQRHKQQPFSHQDCPHGLGHGFMAMLEYELLDALHACDEAMTEAMDQEFCYSGVFMQNIMDEDDSSQFTKHLKPDQPLYPCTEVATRYKNKCYLYQVVYALKTQGNDFAKVFDLCATAIEDDSRPACYESLGKKAAGDSIEQYATGVGETTSTNTLCALGEDYEARSNCAVGAVKQFIFYYQSDEQVKALCESFDADLRAVCLQVGEEFYEEKVSAV
jgi:hypothetical protein